MKTSFARFAGVLLACVVINTPAYAGGVNGLVKRVNVGSINGVPYLQLSLTGTFSPQPPCSLASGPHLVVIDLSTETGRAQAIIANAAFFTDTALIINGTGDCNFHPAFETVRDLISDRP